MQHAFLSSSDQILSKQSLLCHAGEQGQGLYLLGQHCRQYSMCKRGRKDFW